MTQRTIAAQYILSQNPRAKTTTLKWVKPNTGPRTQYLATLQQYVAEMTDEVTRKLLPLIDDMPTLAADSVASDAVTPSSQRLRDLLDQLAQKFGLVFSGMAQQQATQFVSAQSAQATAALNTAFVQAFGVDMTPLFAGQSMTAGFNEMLSAEINWNTSLIKSLPTEYLGKVEASVMKAVANGERASSLAKRINDLTGQTMRRCKTIARDQTQKVINATDRVRAQSMGIDEYQWRTVEDERVRPTHAANDLRWFRFSSPPSTTGNPGHDVNCRCVARLKVVI